MVQSNFSNFFQPINVANEKGVTTPKSMSGNSCNGCKEVLKKLASFEKEMKIMKTDSKYIVKRCLEVIFFVYCILISIILSFYTKFIHISNLNGIWNNCN